MSPNIDVSQLEQATVVIPAYNEENHISAVLDALYRIEDIGQIIVVDDGSTDNTCVVVRRQRRQDQRIQLLCLPRNSGKGAALLAGADRSDNDLVVFLDADLIGLQPENVRALMTPVKQGDCSMALGIFNHGRRLTDISHKLTPFLSGQRCLRWSLFKDTPGGDAARWGIESALSLHAWRTGYVVQKVPWPGMTHAMRQEKMKGLAGYWSHVQMWLDIGRYLLKYLLVGRGRHARLTRAVKVSSKRVQSLLNIDVS